MVSCLASPSRGPDDIITVAVSKIFVLDAVFHAHDEVSVSVLSPDNGGHTSPTVLFIGGSDSLFTSAMAVFSPHASVIYTYA